MEQQKQHFLIYGAGVIGSIFAGRLFAAEYKVTLLARNDRLGELRNNGLILQHALTGKREIYSVDTVDKLDPEDIYDYILVVMQKTQVADVLPILARNKSPNIVFVVNTPSGYKQWIDAIGQERIMIGFPSAGGARECGIVNYFIGSGLNRLFQTTTFGEINGVLTHRLENLVIAFNKAGFPTTTSKNMDAWQKTHVAVVSPIANAIYMFNGNNYDLGESPEGVKLMLDATREGFQALEKLGIPITPKKLRFYYLPNFILVPIFKTIMKSKVAEVAMAKHANIGKKEMKQLEHEFKHLLAQANIKTPAIDELAKYGQLSLNQS